MEKAIIIGAGPAGLTTAYELVKRGIKPIIIERDSIVGGIARTIQYKDYRFDIGGHRFFTKNKEIENMWKEIMKDDFLTRQRLSRWYFQKKFFEYPIKPFEIIWKFGFKSILFILSYLKSKAFPIKPEISAQDWYCNQFGNYLGKMFFTNYNEKLWGIPCSQLSPDFGKQRVKGVTFFSTIMSHFRKTLVKSLIDSFQYPKYGPGMMWEKMKEFIEKRGGQFLFNQEVICINHKNNKIYSVTISNSEKTISDVSCDYVFSSMPLPSLITSLNPNVPFEIIEIASKLKFRDFVTISLIINKKEVFPDNWIYTHDEGMKCIRIQNYNNWSPYMNSKKGTTCLGFEYTCQENDDFWKLPDEDLKFIAVQDLIKTGFAEEKDVIDFKVIKMKEAYPIYDLNYKENVEKIKEYLKQFKNLQCIGRGGLFKYNNMDHSMMTSILAVKNFFEEGNYDVWNVNADAEYHEENRTANK